VIGLGSLSGIAITKVERQLLFPNFLASQLFSKVDVLRNLNRENTNDYLGRC